MQAGPLLLAWRDVARCIVGSDFLRLEARPGAEKWAEVKFPLDARQKSAVVASLEKLLPAGAVRIS